MSDTWYIDLRNFLDKKGSIPEDLPNPASGLVNHIGSIIAAASSPERGPFFSPERQMSSKAKQETVPGGD